MLVLLLVVEGEKGNDGIVLERPVPSGEHRHMQPGGHCKNIKSEVIIWLAYGVGCSPGFSGHKRKAQPPHMTWLDLNLHLCIEDILGNNAPPTI